MLSVVSGKKENQWIYITKQKQIHRYREQTDGYQWEEGREERQDRGMGLRDTNTMYKIRNKDIFYSTRKYSHIL